MSDARCFVVVVDDYLRMMSEVEQVYSMKNSLRALTYTVEVQLIDLQTELIKSQTEQHRNFDKNYAISQKYQECNEEYKKASASYVGLCQRLNADLDRIDAQRMVELERCIDRLLKNLLNAQAQAFNIAIPCWINLFEFVDDPNLGNVPGS